MVRKSLKLACLLTIMGALTFGLSGLASADAPAPDFYKKRVVRAKPCRDINYPAYLNSRSCDTTYEKYIKPARGYDFTVYPLASYYHVSDWE